MLDYFIKTSNILQYTAKIKRDTVVLCLFLFLAECAHSKLFYYIDGPDEIDTGTVISVDYRCLVFDSESGKEFDISAFTEWTLIADPWCILDPRKPGRVTVVKSTPPTMELDGFSIEAYDPSAERGASLDITLVNSDTSSCEKFTWIEGDDYVPENSTGKYGLLFESIFIYEDPESGPIKLACEHSDLTEESIWQSNDPRVSFDQPGIISFGEIKQDTLVVITASHQAYGHIYLPILIYDTDHNYNFSGGSGSPEDPYQLSNHQHFKYLQQHSIYYNDHFIITEDIDFAERDYSKALIAPYYPDGQYPRSERGGFVHTLWGTWKEGKTEFKGVLDGNRHILGNLEINGQDYVSLFGSVTGNEKQNRGLIKNIVMKNCSINATGNYSALLASQATLATFTNCQAQGQVNGKSFIGGLLGSSNGSRITACSTSGAVSGESCWNAGGLVGFNSGKGRIENCYSTASVTGDINIGGLAGNNFSGYIGNCYSSGFITGSREVGGLVGRNSGIVQESFWDLDSSGQPESDGGTGLIKKEISNPLTYFDAGWDFVGESKNGEQDYWRYVRLNWPILQYGKGTTVYVNSKATSGDQSGTDWSNAFTNLHQALYYADEVLKLSGSTTDIWLKSGTYTPDTGSNSRLGPRYTSFKLPAGVKLYGGFKGSETDLTQRDPRSYITILSGDNNGDDLDGIYSDNSLCVVSATDADSQIVIDGITIRNSFLTRLFGYCIKADHSILQISDCILSYEGSSNFGGPFCAQNSLVLLDKTDISLNDRDNTLIRLVGSTFITGNDNHFGQGQLRFFNSTVEGKPIELDRDNTIISETWITGQGESIAHMYGGSIEPALIFEPDQINLTSTINDLVIIGQTKTWVICPSSKGSGGKFSWTGSRSAFDNSSSGQADCLFYPGGELVIEGQVYEISTEEPGSLKLIDTNGEQIMLKARIEGIRMQEDTQYPDNFSAVKARITVTGGYLAKNSQLSTFGRLSLSMQFGSVEQYNANDDQWSDLENFGDPIRMSSPAALEISIDSHSMNMTKIKSHLTGPADIECQSATRLILDNVDLSSNSISKGEISVQGDVLITKHLNDSVVNILDAPVLEDGQIHYDDIAGRLIVGQNAYVTNNAIYCQGDQFMLFESDNPDLTRISGNDITLVFQQGKNAAQGMLMESASTDQDCAAGGINPECKSGIYQVPLAGRFINDPANNWLLEQLEVRADARLNLTDTIWSSDGNPMDAVYGKDLVLHPRAVLNLGLSTLYYENIWLADDQGQKTLYTGNIESTPHTFSENQSSIINIPLLGFSLVIIAMDDETHHPDNEFDKRVRIRRKEPGDSNIGQVNLRMGQRGPGNGIMDMQTGNTSSIAAKGTFARAASDLITVEFEFLFIEDPHDEAEMIVYLSDSPQVSESLVEIARIKPPSPGRPGSIGSENYAVFTGKFPKGDLNFTHGTYIELELRGKDARCWIDNWDPKIDCFRGHCGDYGGWQLGKPEMEDYLLLLSHIGLVHPSSTNKGCLDLVTDGVVDIKDLSAWGIEGFDNLCPDSSPADVYSMPLMTAYPDMNSSDVNGITCDEPIIILGKPKGDRFSVPNSQLYCLDDSGSVIETTQSSGTGRLTVDSTGNLFEIHSNEGLIHQETQTPILKDVDYTWYGDLKVYTGYSGSDTIPLQDAAFAPDNPAELYVAPVLIRPNNGSNPYKAAARLVLSGNIYDPNYVVDMVYGLDPNSDPAVTTSLTGLGSVVTEPDMQHISEIEVDSDGNVYVLSVHGFTDNKWILVYNKDDGNSSRLSFSLSDFGIETPVNMSVSSHDNKLYLSSAATESDTPMTKVYRLSIIKNGNTVTSLALDREIEVIGPQPAICVTNPQVCTTGIYITAITSLTVNQQDGTVYAAGYTAPKFPDELEMFPFEIEGIFTTPFITSVPGNATGPVIGHEIDGQMDDIALPLSIAWINRNTDPCMGADISGNGTVNLEDFTYMAEQWLKTPGSPSADIYPIETGDDTVDITDLMVLTDHWLMWGCN